jgi:hypothetical protein
MVIGLTTACVWGVVSAHPRVSTALTWRADIKPLFDRQCVSCHAPGNAANTVPLATYDQVRPWVAAIREEVLERRMPLPRGRPGIDPGVDDHPLSPMERDVIIGWIDGGAPEGRAAANADSAALTESETPAATFWCRMHPEIRVDRAGACPLCGMELAAFTPDLARRYGWTVRADSRKDASRASSRERSSRERSPRGGSSQITLRIADAATGAAVRDFELVHEYPLHLFVVSEDFSDFRHIHPAMDARGQGEWTVLWRAAKRGRYWVYGDFLPVGGAPQMLQRMITVDAIDAVEAAKTVKTAKTVKESPRVADYASMPASTSASASPSASPLKATLSTSTLRTGDEARITIALTDAKSGAPVSDLQPYLGAWGHLFVLHEGRDEALHAHPDSTATMPGGPAIAFDVMFPRPGTYHLWMQVQRRGAIVTLPFVVSVSPRA